MDSRIPFPTRAIMVRPPSQGQAWKPFVVALFCLVLIGVFTWLQAPGLLNDFSMRDRVETAKAAQILRGQCRTKGAVFHMCEATIRQRVNGVAQDTKHDLFFVDFSRGRYTTQVLQDRDNPALVTTQLALDMLPNRIILFAVFMIFFIAGLIVSIREIFQTRERNALYAALSGDVLRPVPVHVTGMENLGPIRGKKWQFQTLDGTAVENRFPNKAQPFFIDGARRKALAVQGSRGQVLMLDEALSFLKLEPHEVQALRNWQGAAAARSAA